MSSRGSLRNPGTKAKRAILAHCPCNVKTRRSRSIKCLSDRSHWCRFEFDVVHHRYLHERVSSGIAEEDYGSELAASVGPYWLARIGSGLGSHTSFFSRSSVRQHPKQYQQHATVELLSSPTVSRRVFGDRLNTRLFIRSPSTGNSGILTFSPGHLRQSALWQPGLSPITLTSYDPKTAFLRFYCPQ